MRILLTNHALVNRQGSELYIRDVAAGLLRRGHSPIAYSTKLGEVATEIRKGTVPVVDNLASVAVAPDVIHGQHHIETMSALLHFPNVPAVYICHGFVAWEEKPPRFPRILRYVAVDDACRDRLLYEQGIPEKQVVVIRNFADLEKFKQRGPLPEKPKRALLFGSDYGDVSHVKTVMEACDRAGLTLDVIGLEPENITAEPETVLANYDVVFTKGRCAFEALAVGTAVIVCDHRGLGPMVTPGQLEELKLVNFGSRAMRETNTVENIARQLARYDRDDAAEVTRRIRASSGLEQAVDQMLSVYEEVIAEYRKVGSNGNGNPLAENQFTAAYLRDVALHITHQREAIYRSTSYRIGNFLVRTPVLSGIVKRLAGKKP